MIAILDNLISTFMLPMGFALDYLILLLITPIGFFFVFSSIVFFEYKTIKSIVKNTNLINLKEIFAYIEKKRSQKDVSLVSSRWLVLNTILEK